MNRADKVDMLMKTYRILAKREQGIELHPNEIAVAKDCIDIVVNDLIHQPKYVALIQKRTEFGNRHFMISNHNETKSRFTERVNNCYIKPYENTDTPHYWEVEIYELGEI